ncbi:ABC transporter substrate-binding protein [Candidatus Woesearchaeota archaeon]|nr:ABC transporter substrate-binding protein [Candidatus Woesearchaeota archaeon]
MKKFYLLLLLTTLLISCSQTDQNKIKIGAILPLTGPYAVAGIDAKNAIDLALEEIGNKIQVIYEDSGGENSKAVSSFNKLVNLDNSKIVITSTSWISNTLYSQAIDSNVLQAVIASAGFTRAKEKDKAIRFTVAVKEEAQYLKDYLKKFNRIAVFYLNNDFGKFWADEIKNEFQDKVVALESRSPTDIDMKAQFAKIKDSNPDILFLGNGGGPAALDVRKAKELGINAQIVGSRPIESQEVIQEKATEGLIFSSPDYNQDHPIISKYKSKYNKEPTIFAVEAYDTIMTLAKATENCKEDTTCIYNWHLNKEYEGILGKINFDEKANAHYPFILKQVKDGKFILYE